MAAVVGIHLVQLTEYALGQALHCDIHGELFYNPVGYLWLLMRFLVDWVCYLDSSTMGTMGPCLNIYASM